ncbi:RdgB/HAM1 family non-canonical purine NTP pyrophosphatase [Pleomorphovibrio marinus]|uniref:RdgB/HAM1 family non-canonical purine NTP pyrophosphatase n=1 Tax=Pleomorphovibrio marinus TaxID=2164132 RepID=UPI000E0C99DA|nr:RdgB/HAM1 family non-canonical purine NTP pyrophosphatase [Pleomorphovibrio marinus]
MRKICFASNNPKKLEEIRKALEGKLEILSLEELGCREELEETGESLLENAFQKARYVHTNYGIDCFADDTGLEVDALQGAPGVYSGRFAGEPRSDERNVDLLLSKMQGKGNRLARFKTVIALIAGGEEFSFEGEVIGKIATSRTGSGGFGYDPVFVPEGYDRSFAELSLEEKNSISHRGKAVRKLREFLLRA